MALYILPSLLRQCSTTTCGICKRTEYHESFNTVSCDECMITQMSGQAFICPDCCLYHGSYLIGSFIQVKIVDVRLDSNSKEYQWKLYLIVGWNELDGYHILRDLDGSYQIHFIGTCPYLLRTLLDVVAEVTSED